MHSSRNRTSASVRPSVLDHAGIFKGVLISAHYDITKGSSRHRQNAKKRELFSRRIFSLTRIVEVTDRNTVARKVGTKYVFLRYFNFMDFFLFFFFFCLFRAKQMLCMNSLLRGSIIYSSATGNSVHLRSPISNIIAAKHLETKRENYS